MPVALYFDHNIAHTFVTGLRRRGVDVLTAFEDDRSEWDDAALLDRATELGRVLFTHDRDFLREAAHRQRAGIEFSGIIFAPMDQDLQSIYLRNLELIALAGEPEEMASRVLYLPL